MKAVLVMAVSGAAQVAMGDAGPYAWRGTTLDAGGSGAASAHYALESNLGEPGFVAESGDGRVSHRQGYVGGLNEAPVPRADTARSGSDYSAKVRVATLLANDGDPEGDPLVLRAADAVSVSGGRIVREGNWLLYEPPTPFPGMDSFRYTVEDAAGNAAPALVTILVADPGLAPSPNLIAVSLLPEGNRYLAFGGIAGRSYTIQWSDQLPALHWEALATVQANSRGLIEWVDSTQPAPPERYYRTVSP